MMARVINTKAGPYKMKFRPDPITRLCRFTGWTRPLPMAGNPPEAAYAISWDKWCRIVYEANLNAKRGIVIVPKSKRRGLWHHAV